MKCFATGPEIGIVKRTAPERILKGLLDESRHSLMFTGFEASKLMCYALFSESKENPDEVWLDYIYTSPDHREEGCATELLSFARDYLKELGASSIICRLIVSYANAGDFSSFFQNRDFIPLTLTGRLLVYDFNDMLDPGVFQLLEKKRTMLPPIISYDKASKLTLFKTIPISIMEGEKQLSCFFAGKGGIYGAAAAYNADSRTLVIREIYLEKDAEKKGLFLPMLAAVVEEAKKSLDEENMRIQIFLHNETEYRGLMQIFNPPEEEYLVMEFMNVLK